MSLFLRHQTAQDIAEGRKPRQWQMDDYAVLDDAKVVGRIYRDKVPGGVKWAWLLAAVPGAPDDIQPLGHADTLEEARAALTAQYRKACAR